MNGKGQVKIGVVCLARRTFDFEAAHQIYLEKIVTLRAIPNTEWVIHEPLVIEKDEAQAAAETIRQAGVDGVIIISGTFHLGHLALIIYETVKQPVLLWALKELPYDGGKIRLNSVCGLNLNASNLYKSGCDSYAYCLGDDVDQDWINALRMKAALSDARIGIAGYRADGFFNISIDDLQAYRNFGILIDHYELSDAMGMSAAGAAGAPSAPGAPSASGAPRPETAAQSGAKAQSEAAPTVAQIRDTFDCSCLKDEQVAKVSGAASAMRNLMHKDKLDALAVRCWPEFANQFGISPCASMSLLASEGYIVGCEGDVEGTLSMLAAQAASGETPFLADLSQVDIDQDYALMWHCGVASPTLWDGHSAKTLDTYFAGGRGVTAGFVMKSGRVSMMRLDTARGKTRLFVAGGVAVPMEKALTGTYAKVCFDKSVAKVLQSVINNGVAHHVAMVYGDYTEAFRKFARLNGFEVIE